MDKRKTFMEVHQALKWVNALSEAESDGGEVSGLSDVGSLFHGHCTLHMFNLSLNIENQCIIIAGQFYP